MKSAVLSTSRVRAAETGEIKMTYGELKDSPSKEMY